MRGKARSVVGVWVAALLSLTACKPTSSPLARYIESGPPRYEVSCPEGETCNESVALLVGLSAPMEPTRCTAALIGPSTVLTARHCIAWELSHGNSCSGLWLGFAGAARSPAEWVGCRRIQSVSASGNDLLSADYAVLELERSVVRPFIPLGTGEVAKGEVVRVLSVTADRFYDDQHEVRSRRCVVDDNQRLAQWSTEPSPSIRVLSSCPIHQGSSGAPVLDGHGRLRGLVHAGGPRYFALGLMTLLPEPIDSHDG